MVNLFLIDRKECEKKKCSAQKLVRLGRIKLCKGNFSGIILSPFGKKSLLMADRDLILKSGLATIDCSWNKIENEKRVDGFFTGRNTRYLPFLLAANSINYGRPFRLNNLEAYLAALAIVGLEEEAIDLTAGFDYGLTFLELNGQLLEAYKNCMTEDEQKKCVDEFYE